MLYIVIPGWLFRHNLSHLVSVSTKPDFNTEKLNWYQLIQWHWQTNAETTKSYILRDRLKVTLLCTSKAVDIHFGCHISQMDTNLEMNAMKSSSFNVKDLLDLPTDKGVSVVGSAGELSGQALASLPSVPDVTPPPPYYDTDNPYTRWLHTNENMHYSCEYLISCTIFANHHYFFDWQLLNNYLFSVIVKYLEQRNDLVSIDLKTVTT